MKVVAAVIGVKEEANAADPHGTSFQSSTDMDFEGWVMVQVAKVPEEERVPVAAIHLEGKAMQWHRGFESLHGYMASASWRCYASALAACFGAHAYEDPVTYLRNLKQKGHYRSK